MRGHKKLRQIKMIIGQPCTGVQSLFYLLYRMKVNHSSINNRYNTIQKQRQKKKKKIHKALKGQKYGV